MNQQLPCGVALPLEKHRDVNNAVICSLAVYKRNPWRNTHAHDIHEVTGPVIESDDKQIFLLADTVPKNGPMEDYPDPPVIIAFRGTVGRKDLCTDFLIKAKTFRGIGKVHQGFLDRAESVPLSIVQHYIEQGRRLVITGHSLGGAVAVLFALTLFAELRLELRDRVTCITFGCPLLGDKNIAAWVERKGLQDKFIFLTNHLDLVPKLLVIFEEVKEAFKDGIHNVLQQLANVAKKVTWDIQAKVFTTDKSLLTAIVNLFLSFLGRMGSLMDVEIPSFFPFGIHLQYDHYDNLIALTESAFMEAMRLPVSSISDIHFMAHSLDGYHEKLLSSFNLSSESKKFLTLAPPKPLLLFRDTADATADWIMWERRSPDPSVIYFTISGANLTRAVSLTLKALDTVVVDNMNVGRMEVNFDHIEFECLLDKMKIKRLEALFELEIQFHYPSGTNPSSCIVPVTLELLQEGEDRPLAKGGTMLQMLSSKFPRPQVEVGERRRMLPIPYPVFHANYTRTNSEPAGILIYRRSQLLLSRGGIRALSVFINTHEDALSLEAGKLELFALQPGRNHRILIDMTYSIVASQEINLPALSSKEIRVFEVWVEGIVPPRILLEDKGTIWFDETRQVLTPKLRSLSVSMPTEEGGTDDQEGSGNPSIDDIVVQERICKGSNIDLNVPGSLIIKGVECKSILTAIAGGDIKIKENLQGDSSHVTLKSGRNVFIEGKADGSSLLVITAEGDITIDGKIDGGCRVELYAGGSIRIHGKIDHEKTHVHAVAGRDIIIGKKIDGGCQVWLRASNQLIIKGKIDNPQTRVHYSAGTIVHGYVKEAVQLILLSDSEKEK